MAIENINLLVVEDNDADFRLVAEYLKESEGVTYNVSRLKLLAAVPEILAKKKFDAALLDLELPDSRGLGILDKIAAWDPALALLVLTGMDDEHLGREAVKKGAQDYLVKNHISGGLLTRSLSYALERKRTGEDLRQSEERYRTLFNSLIEGYGIIEMLFDANGKPTDYRFLEVNPAFEEQTGLHNAQGKTMRELAPEHEEHWFEIYGKIAQTGEPLRFESEARALGRWFEVYAFRMGGPESRKVAIYFNDISERKRAVEILKRDKESVEKLVREQTLQLFETRLQLERTKRLSDIGTLAATVAHELRNPLAAIGMAVLKIAQKDQTLIFEKYTTLIKKKISESDQIINNLLFYSRLKPPHYESLLICDLIQECIETAKAHFKKAAAIVWAIELDKNIRLEADPTQCQEVINNLLNNACDAVPPAGGEIGISCTRERDWVVLVVKDNGSGMAGENLAKAFDPFFTTKAKGTGLGLAVCKQIIGFHGGSIELQSESGLGTSVIVRLPGKTGPKGC